MLKKIFLLLELIFFVSYFYAQTPEEILSVSDEAIAAENWEKAIDSLQTGMKKYPDDYIFPLKLGIIYYNKGLYQPAYKLFKKGLQLDKDNSDFLFYLSNTSAALNQNEEALQYLKKYLLYVPEDRYAAANYGWLCFKCHKAKEGIAFCLDNIKRYGEHLSVCNSLGTLYSEIFDYKNSKKFYTKAIQYAKAENKKYSASIYYYNKAILESSFYNFAEALEDAEAALKMQERNSSYMMIGELEARRNNFKEALAAYTAAAAIDNTPLGTLNAGNIFLSTGNFEQAEQLLSGILNNTDEAWISNYGLSVNEFKSSIYKFKQALYEQKYNFEKTKLSLNFFDWIKTVFNGINYKLKYKYYDSVYRVYSLKVAKEYKKEGKPFLNDSSYILQINSLYFEAFKDKGNKQLKYFENAEKIETEFIPKSEGSYIAERALIEKDLKMLNDGISKMNPEWEKDSIGKLYAQGVKIANKRSPKFYYLYLESLFDINPAAFLQYDINLPVKINVSLQKNKSVKISEKKIFSIINSSRFNTDSNSKFELQIKYLNNVLSFRLLNKNGFPLFTQNFNIEKLDKTNFKKAVNGLVKKMFTIKL
ncbi:tetratricopeptide repeat protein [Treponema pedis]|uniref:Transglutaminase n=2 Tax=Treponema pedis TaxID=409322 RepID=S6A2Z5_9SPIR|nr:tetratricopeptide repeat protein [Treponema pedis]AGT43086.1 transglutaminase [Treponema pedis str. T A4]